eukprot:m51a1_g4556 hypothetical protein (265) ;mRNA; r:92602-93753
MPLQCFQHREWDLGPAQTALLLATISSLNRTSTAVNLHLPSLPALGYRGFHVETRTHIIGVFRGLVSVTSLASRSETPEYFGPGRALEEWLLGTAHGDLFLPTVRDYVLEAIRRYHPLVRGAGKEVRNDDLFAEWNSPRHVSKNNCYNFATDTMTDTFAQPGRGSGAKFRILDCDHVKEASLRDGLRETGVTGGWEVALVVWPHHDFHWYRYVKEDETWYHKPGTTPVRNYDNSGVVITDPESCDLGPYSFCNYLTATHGMKIN